MSGATHDDFLGPAHDALNRMRKAYENGRGCRLSWEELNCLSVGLIGEVWNVDDPREVTADMPKGEKE